MYGTGEVCKQLISCSILCVISVCRTDEIYASGFEIMLKNLASHCVILSRYQLGLFSHYLAQRTFGGSEDS